MEIENSVRRLIAVLEGGEGSGNFAPGHRGIPEHQGGSLPSGDGNYSGREQMKLGQKWGEDLPLEQASLQKGEKVVTLNRYHTNAYTYTVLKTTPAYVFWDENKGRTKWANMRGKLVTRGNVTHALGEYPNLRDPDYYAKYHPGL
jgi:hypothetical protein